MIRVQLQDLSQDAGSNLSIRIIGLGGAGINVVDRVALDGFDKSKLVALNTDIQSLAASVAGQKIQLGKHVTHGLGTGGDPELGLAAAEEAFEDLSKLFDNVELIFLTVGLGGGTGSGTAPTLAKMASERGVPMIVFATLPFTFEGRRRNEQATMALRAIQKYARAVVCFENDRMSEAVSPKAGIHEAFTTADSILGQSIRSIIDFLAAPGLIRVGLDELLHALKGQNTRCIFGYGEADGPAAPHDALASSLKSPLMERGKRLDHAGNVLVHITGGTGMTLANVQSLMDGLGKHIGGHTQILLGIGVDRELGTRIRVSVLSSIGEASGHTDEIPRHEAPAYSPEPEELEPEPEEEYPPVDEPPEEEPSEPPPVEIYDESEPEPEPESTPALEPPARSGKSAKEVKQEAFEFEPVTKGRFAKSEPNIVDGEDLDIPTFMRKKPKG